MKSVCVFCGSQPGNDPRFTESAAALGRAIASRGATLVYGGASVGLMGTAANAALAAGGKVVGVIPKVLMREEVAHRNLTEMHVVETMHQRKALMEKRSDAFVALPGGFGTLDELCEILAWSQLGMHQKPVGLLNVANYFDGLIQFFDHAASSGLLRASNREKLLIAEDPTALFAKFDALGCLY